MNVATPAANVIVDDPLRLPEKMNTSRRRTCLGGFSIECCRLFKSNKMLSKEGLCTLMTHKRLNFAPTLYGCLAYSKIEKAAVFAEGAFCFWF